MPTFNEIGAQYARRIREALEKDGFRRGVPLTESIVRRSLVARELTAISTEVDTYWRIRGRPLTQEEKDRIVGAAGRALRMRVPSSLRVMLRCASNDEYVELVNYISNLLQESDT